MAIFNITINDTSSLVGIAAARINYNSNLPKDDKGNIIGELTSDSAYIQMIVSFAAESYAKQFGLVITAAEKAALEDKLSKAVVKG